MTVIDRRRLGMMLRAQRTAAGLTLEQVSSRLKRAGVQMSTSAIGYYETGKRTPRPQDLTLLLRELGVEGIGEQEEYHNVAHRAREASWWRFDSSYLRPSFQELMGLEAAAASMTEYSVTMFPGLLQTGSYARAVLGAANPKLDDQTIEARVKVRMARQQTLIGEAGTLGHLHVVLDEGCIRRKVGGSSVWQDQLQHVLLLGKRQSVTVQILPFEAGAHAGVLGGFTMLDFAEASPIVYLELPGTDLYEEGDVAERYKLLFDKLREQALPEALSLKLVTEVANGK